MTTKEIIKRISTLLLAFMLTLSMTGGAFMEAFAEDGEGQAEQPITTEESEGTIEESTEAVPAAEEETQPAEQPSVTEDAEEEKAQEPAAEEPENEPAEEVLETPEATLKKSEPAMEGSKAEEPSLPEIKVRASRDGTFLTVFWKKADNAEYYMVYLDNDTVGTRVEAANTVEYRKIFNAQNAGSVVSVRVEAYRMKEEPAQTDQTDQNGENGQTGGTGQTGATTQPGSGAENTDPPATVKVPEKIAEGKTIEISKIIRGALSSFTSRADYTGLSLRTMIGEGNGGYAVAQGSAAGGGYMFHVMASSENQKGRIVRINLSNPADYAAGPVIDIHHANGMTYDSKRGRLVAVGYGNWRQQLTFIDPNSLTIISQQNLNYPYSDMEGVQNGYASNGVAAIAYVEKYDVFVTRVRGDIVSAGNNDIMVYDAGTLNLIGYVRTKVTSAYNGTYQSMDADDKYVYFLVSPGGNVKGNIIICLDWNSENLIPVRKGDISYVKDMWYCNNNGSGAADAVITIPVGKESEGLFHTTDASGNEHFYVTEYYGRWMYKTVTKKVKYKKKWKKVRKWYNKKTKKWTTKKPKKKYRGKSKKVWKYKTKTKKVKETVKDYWARDDYVYDLGVF